MQLKYSTSFSGDLKEGRRFGIKERFHQTMSA